MAESVFSEVKSVEPIEVFQLTKLYNECDSPRKVNLGVGAYRTNEGKPYVLNVVRTAEAQMAADTLLNHEYLPISGLPDFRTAAAELLLGKDHAVVLENRWEAFQGCGGTGAIKLAAVFLKSVLGFDVVYVSNPTWGNHKTLFSKSGFSQVRQYRYWDSKTRGLDFAGMKEDLNNAPENSVVILHAVAHNPTGVDPTPDQWVEICSICKEKKLFVLMDNAYQGFASGDLDKDAAACRHFANQNMDMMVAQSFSKNFGLYNERTGNLVVITKSQKVLPPIRSQMEVVIRCIWSNPPNHGARIVTTVLRNKTYFDDWKNEVKNMANRIISMRAELRKSLIHHGAPGNWDHITNQIGMFCYTGLNEKQAEYLKNERHIFLLRSGRISMCGLTPKNIDYVATSIKAALEAYPNKHEISFVEFARRKLSEPLSNVIATEVVIEGIMLKEGEDDTGVEKAHSAEEFVKVFLEGCLSSSSSLVIKKSDHSVTEDETDTKKAGIDEKEEEDEDVNSKQTEAGTFRTSVKTYRTQSAQTIKTKKGETVEETFEPQTVPTRFEGTMMTPVFFDGLMMTPEKLDHMLQAAAERGEEMSIPVVFRGGMLTAAFKSLAQNLGQGEDAAPVDVQFHGHLSGVLNNTDGIPVNFQGSMKPMQKKGKKPH